MTDLPTPSGAEPEQPQSEVGIGSTDAENAPLLEPVAMLHLWQIQPIRDLLWLVLIIIAIWVGYEMRSVTVPLLVALLLAYLFEPLIRWAARTAWVPLNRIAAITVLLVISIIIFLVAMVLVIPLLLGQTLSFISAIESGTIHDRLSRLVQQYAPEGLEPEFQDVVNYLPTKRAPDKLGRATDKVNQGSDTATQASATASKSSGSLDQERKNAEASGLTDSTSVQEMDRQELNALIDLHIQEASISNEITAQSSRPYTNTAVFRKIYS